MNQYRILIVDDDQEFLTLIERGLSFSGYDITSAKSGAEAVELTKRILPHVVLLDMMMPEMDGIETLRQIRQFDRDVKVVIISGMHDVQAARDAISLGAVDYITKPFELHDLDSYISSLLSQAP